MFYRAFIILTVAFWLTMTGLLIRLEIAPEKSTVLDVPVSHVVALMFAHGQPSVLGITQNGHTIGSVVFRPHADADERSVAFSGSLMLELPFVVKQRISWNGALDMDRTMKMRSAQFELNLTEPATRILLRIAEPARTLHNDIERGPGMTFSADIPLDAAGLGALASQLDFDPNGVLAMTKEAPQITARQTDRAFRGEKISVFQISIRQGEAPLAEIYLSQLGQVLEATTTFGYTFTSHD